MAAKDGLLPAPVFQVQFCGEPASSMPIRRTTALGCEIAVTSSSAPTLRESARSSHTVRGALCVVEQFTEIMTSLQAISDQIAEHERHVAALLAQAAPLRAAARSDAIAQVRAKIVEFGLTTRELGFRFGGSSRIPKSSAAATAGPYFHPNTHESWSGHGRRPLWVESALATGYSLKSLQRRPT